MPRRSQINYLCDRSDGFSIVLNHSGNAQITGTDYGFIVLEHDTVDSKIRAKILLTADQDIALPSAQSADIPIASLPATISILEVGGSGISGTVAVDGVNT